MSYVYVDESGNLGKNDKYFTIAAIVCTDQKSFSKDQAYYEANML